MPTQEKQIDVFAEINQNLNRIAYALETLANATGEAKSGLTFMEAVEIWKTEQGTP